ncbi:MAG: type 3 dihydrofolate reductase [Candidatus Competibacteraceae bacterium]
MSASPTLIAALARNRVIGRDNRLPWHLPADLRFFKQVTMGKPLLMGRRTWESIGRPLPGRRMIVLSRDPAYHVPGCTVARSLDEALAIAGAATEPMVIGGATLYRQTLPQAERLYLTLVEADVPGDAWFPEWDARDWRLVWEEANPADAKHVWPYRFQRWERMRDLNGG